jgi:hypothetical protein
MLRAVDGAAQRGDTFLDAKLHVARGDSRMTERVAPDPLDDRHVVDGDVGWCDEPTGYGKGATDTAGRELRLARRLPLDDTDELPRTVTKLAPPPLFRARGRTDTQPRLR